MSLSVKKILWRLFACALIAAPCTVLARPSGPPEAEVWERVKDTNDTAVLKRFLADHGSGKFAAQARERLRALDASAPPPPPGPDPHRSLAAMVRFDRVMQMRPTPLSSNAAPSWPTSPPPSPALADTTPPPPRPAPPLPASSAPVQVSGSPVPPQQKAAKVAVALPEEPSNLLDRPQMIAFDMPVLPAAFCDVVDQNSYLEDFHQPLDRAAHANNDAAIRHMTRLNARFTELVKSLSDVNVFLEVDKEVKAYKVEADLRFKTALAVNDLDRQIRGTPIQPGGACAHAPWPSPIHIAPASAASGR